MKANLTINGKVIEVEITDGLELKISDEQLKALEAKQAKPTKKTGYERLKGEHVYYCDNGGIDVQGYTETYDDFDTNTYSTANYYSDRTVAENNVRADKLLRQLRRFAVEHRENAIDWHSNEQYKYYIYYACKSNTIRVSYCRMSRNLGQIHFDTQETAELAIKEFKGELMWYFTEYKDSL